MAETVLSISKELVERIRAHGAETYPDECCGALLGRDLESREIVALFPVINRRDDSPRNRFSVSAQDVVDAEKSARAQGLDVVGWYHSHPDHPARPSQYDRDHAWPWYSYIIVSVAQGQPQDMTSWRLDDNREQFSSEGIQIRQGASV
ncbi:MAG TPA: M67 family metallopeptidase [Candidatus Dormibacteraeota bacterium]|nr:M67 family metallopeptidase [Candidatus Dormibacteraeota bacterium]